MNTFNLTLDLNKSRAANPVRIRQGDVQGTTITALILDHGATADLTGYTAQFVMDLPDGTHYYRKAASISGNTVTVIIDETQAASVTGRTTLAYVQLLRGSTVKASTGCVTVEVLPDALDGKTVPESYDSAIQDAIDALDAAVEQMPDMVEDVLADHPEWTTTVQDGSITKDKLATDLARDRERLLYRLDNLLTNALPEGETATATDAAKTPMAGLALYGRSTQDGTPTPSAPVLIVSVTPDSDGGVKLMCVGRNLLNPAQAFGGVTYYTVNADGTLTVKAEDTRSWASVPVAPLAAGTYTLSISGNDGGRVTYHVVDGSAETSLGIIGSGSGTFTLTSGGGVKIKVHQGTFPRTVRIQVQAGTTATAYEPYTYTVTPIDLDGHELRSLPDGTRDEVTVGADGHAVLVQRVGAVDPSTLAWGIIGTGSNVRFRCLYSTLRGNARVLCTKLVSAPSYDDVFSHRVNNSIVGHPTAAQFEAYASAYADASAFKTALADATLLYPLATPQTIDLGTIDSVPLVGPDLTAQAIPSAPFALTYERDLNATLARLESAIATLA
jgi:hypothetical protein